MTSAREERLATRHVKMVVLQRRDWRDLFDLDDDSASGPEVLLARITNKHRVASCRCYRNDYTGNTLLHDNTFCFSFDLHSLIKIGICVDSRDHHQTTPLHQVGNQSEVFTDYTHHLTSDATIKLADDRIRLLVRYGASFESVDDDDMTALLCAIADGKSVPSSAIETLLELKSDPEAKDTNGSTVLHHAAMNDIPAKMQFFLNTQCLCKRKNLRHGVNKNRDRNTPTHLAEEATLPVLLHNGQSMKVRNKQCQTPIQFILEDCRIDPPTIPGAFKVRMTAI